MEHRERVLKALRREGKPDKVPFEISWGAFTPRLMKVFREETGSEISPDEYFDFDTRFVLPDPSTKKTDFSVFYEEKLDQETTFNEWGYGMVPTPYEIPHFKYNSLGKVETVKQINEYPWPDLGDDYRYVDVAKKVKEYHNRGYAVNGEMYQTIFETAWLLRGMEQLMMDFCLNENLIHEILERITEIRIKQAINFAKAGVDIIRFGDDIVSQTGRMMDKNTYEKFFKFRMQKIIKAAKKINPDIMIFYHCCGKVEEVIDELIETGIEILNPIQPECNNLQMINEKYRTKLSFWGAIGIQSVLTKGSPSDVRNKVKETINLLGGKDGGFLLAPAHILDPSVPWENVIAFIEEAKRS
jgi:uroporphyrinogen decarboxylase